MSTCNKTCVEQNTYAYLTAPSSLVALEERTLLPELGLVGFTETKRPDVDVFAGPRLEIFRSFSSCFCLEGSKDLSKLLEKKSYD